MHALPVHATNEAQAVPFHGSSLFLHGSSQSYLVRRGGMERTKSI
jgi:hypothetical protein